MTKITDWAGCYDEGWGTDITALSYSHPAKMARGLVKRIYAYLLEQGELTPNKTIQVSKGLEQYVLWLQNENRALIAENQQWVYVAENVTITPESTNAQPPSVQPAEKNLTSPQVSLKPIALTNAGINETVVLSPSNASNAEKSLKPGHQPKEVTVPQSATKKPLSETNTKRVNIKKQELTSRATQELAVPLTGNGEAESTSNIMGLSGKRPAENFVKKLANVRPVDQPKTSRFITKSPTDTVEATPEKTWRYYVLPVTEKLISILIELSPSFFQPGKKLWQKNNKTILLYGPDPLKEGDLATIKGDLVVDPFAGIGGTALDAVTNGLNYIGCELEQKFVDLGAGCNCTGISKADWIRFYGRWDRANYKDGRHWCPACLAQAKAAVDESPEQFGLFGQEPTATYKRNSGRIPFTAAHRYQGNIDLFHRRREAKGRAVLLQGDSRQLASVIAQAGGVVGSPPYAESLQGKDEQDYDDAKLNKAKLNGKTAQRATWGVSKGVGTLSGKGYGQTPGQLGAMPEGQPVVVSSPPYAGSVNQSEAANDTEARIERMKRAGIDVNNRANVGGGNGVARQAQAYGDSAGQLGAMKEGDVSAVIGSPPYSNRLKKEGEFQEVGSPGYGGLKAMSDGYSDNPHNLGNMPPGDPAAVISSPPWAGNSGGRGEASRNGIDPALFDRHQGGMVGGIGGPGNLAGLEPGEVGDVIGGVVGSPPFESVTSGHDTLFDQTAASVATRKNAGTLAKFYGDSVGQLGTDSGDTFWAAAKQILLQCAAILPPGRCAVWVVKGFVRSGEIVDFPGQWQALCEACGFETIEIVRAWLVKDKGTQIGLNGEAVKKTVSRKSFFRRLSEKNGAPAIDFEIVLFTRRITDRAAQGA